MTNFDFLKSEKQFAPFADTAVAAERVFTIDPALPVVNCRRSMEFAVKWMYTVDGDLVMPYQDQLISLINTDEFKDIIGDTLFKRLEFIRRIGNNANHNPLSVSRDQAVLALKNLHAFMDFIAYCYGDNYTQTGYDVSKLDNQGESVKVHDLEMDFEKIKAENRALKDELTRRRSRKGGAYNPAPLDMSEDQTRRAYIGVMLTAAGWERGRNWIDEYPVENMPNKTGTGAADYVLFGDDGKPLAIIEAKRTSADIAEGRQQAKLYADDLERRFDKRPIIFLSNGITTHIWTDQANGYPERQVSGIFSRRDLEKEFNKMAIASPLDKVEINNDIASRYYQKEAVKAVCEAFGRRRRRKALLVMATGSGKTRTVISLADILTRHGWVTNFLFLADRNSLVTQAKRFFHNLLPHVSITNLVEEKENPGARGVFSTYQTMMNRIDESTGEEGGRLYTPGHFDLIIVDEAHRSIYNKYKDIFTYFDALLVGLTATPKDDIDKNTYELFDQEAGVPTYGYELP
jgi:type I restriction enzyme R subunit